MENGEEQSTQAWGWNDYIPDSLLIGMSKHFGTKRIMPMAGSVLISGLSVIGSQPVAINKYLAV